MPIPWIVEPISPFTIQGLTFRSILSDEDLYHSEYNNAMATQLRRYPQELWCNDPVNEKTLRKKLTVEFGDTQNMTAQELIQEYDENGPNRMTVESYFGELDPINLAIEDNGEFWGGLHLYGINIVSLSQATIFRFEVHPYLMVPPEVQNPLTYNNLYFDIISYFLNNDPLVGPQGPFGYLQGQVIAVDLLPTGAGSVPLFQSDPELSGAIGNLNTLSAADPTVDILQATRNDLIFNKYVRTDLSDAERNILAG